MSLEPLNDVERRVLGVLIEKSIAQPEYYPMTLNAVVAACNQKSNRDPVMDLDESSVQATLDELRKRGLVSVVLPAPGGRSHRFKHEAAARFGWEKRVTAIVTELLLRGPQTPGELRGRASRMAAFENVEAVMTALDHMQQLDPPLVKPLPRQAGQSAVRYMHLFYPPEETAAIEAVSARHADSTSASSTLAPPARRAPASPGEPGGGVVHATTRAEQAGMGGLSQIEAMRGEIEELKSTIARLTGELNDLRRRFESLESQLI